MKKLEEMNSRFLAKKLVASSAEKLASGTMKIAIDIEKLLEEYSNVMSSETRMEDFRALASSEDIEYTGKIAMILKETIEKIGAIE